MAGMQRRSFLKGVTAASVAPTFAATSTHAQEVSNASLTVDDLAHRGFRVSSHAIQAYVYDDLYYQNEFIKMARSESTLPEFNASREQLPSPFWEGNDVAIDCWWKVWELAFDNLRVPSPESGFPSNFIDTAFNDAIFMWDSAFILMFGQYGRRAFDFLGTFNNFYAKQHYDGFICREIGQRQGDDRFQRFDPTSTGPNVFGWTEWEYYCSCGDLERLAKVFPVLAAYHHWLRTYRTWPDGSYYSSGWGCGMDNQPRLPREMIDQYGHRLHEQFSHGHMAWVDTCMQQILSAKLLVKMAEELGRADQARDFSSEAEFLEDFVNKYLWSKSLGFYCDRYRDGTLSEVMTIGAYWALLAEVVPDGRLGRFVSHLENPRKFNRPHRVPSLAADHQDYQAEDGGYWKGAVWPPTNYMVLRGLTNVGKDELAHEIAKNHLANVCQVFSQTGTVWENYAPESSKPGSAKKDFVGWGGLPPTAVLLEYVFGIRPEVNSGRLLWDLRLTDAHGVARYPYGPKGVVDLQCAKRRSVNDEPAITASSNVPLLLDVRWSSGRKEIRLE